jgi:hypothetical protein
MITHGPIITEHGIVGAIGNGAQQEEYFNHMPAYMVRRLISDDKWNSYFKFCNVRNPWDKTVSWFHHNNNSTKNTNSEEEIILAFRSALKSATKVMRDWHIYTINDQPIVDDYINYSKLEDDFERISNRLNMSADFIPKLKTQWRDNNIPYTAYYDQECRDIVAKMYEPEIALFGWEFD